MDKLSGIADIDEIAETLQFEYDNIETFSMEDIEEPNYDNISEFLGEEEPKEETEEIADVLNFAKPNNNTKQTSEPPVETPSDEMLEEIANPNYSPNSFFQNPKNQNIEFLKKEKTEVENLNGDVKKVNVVFPEDYIPNNPKQTQEEPQNNIFDNSDTEEPEEETEPHIEQTIEDNSQYEYTNNPEPEVEYIINDNYTNNNFVKPKQKESIIKKSQSPLFTSVKKAVASIIVICISLGIIIGLPLAFGKKNGKNEEEKPTTTEAEEINNQQSTQSTTEAIFTPVDSSNVAKDNIFEVSKAEALSYVSGGTGSSRFSSLDDITFYVEGSTMTALSAERQAFSSFNSGLITYEELVAIIDENTAIADSVNHLLIANETTYIEEGKVEKYNELMYNNNVLILYGDIIKYKSQNP